MKNMLHKMRLRIILLCFLSCLSLCLTQEVKIDVKVEDYLSSLSDTDLQQICIDRGFEIAERSDSQPLTHDDLVESARRCLTLEDEMNAILAENPDLAAEIEAEILRMKRAKEELEREREILMREKEMLEQQLRDAGINIKVFVNETEQETPESTDNLSPFPNPQSLEDVLKVSFLMLFDRVKQDVIFVSSIFRPILMPIFGSLRLIWRTLHPSNAQKISSTK